MGSCSISIYSRGMKSFASDNFASVHPHVMQALHEANSGHSQAYGDDPWCARAIEKIRAEFTPQTEVFFVYGGTGANVCSLDACLEKFESVICTSQAHIANDECGAPERYLGAKLHAIPTQNGKLTVEHIKELVETSASEHHVLPRVVSLTQSTELGTMYALTEIAEISKLCKKHNLYLHVDGARIYNAAAALNVSLKALTSDAGVDILSLGGTKNGLMYGEACVVFNKKLGDNMKYVRKQSMQLASKMRFIGAQFEALFSNALWKANAEHANHMARLLAEGIKNDSRVELLYPVQVNALFVKIPKNLRDHLLKDSFFWDWNEAEGHVRWMTSFDTEIKDVENFLAKLQSFKG